jgi:hypothetical protein
MSDGRLGLLSFAQVVKLAGADPSQAFAPGGDGQPTAATRMT